MEAFKIKSERGGTASSNSVKHTEELYGCQYQRTYLQWTYSLPYPPLWGKGHHWHLLLSSLSPDLAATEGTTPGSPQVGGLYLTISYHQLPSSCGMCSSILSIEGSLLLREHLLEVLLNSLKTEKVFRETQPAKKQYQLVYLFSCCCPWRSFPPFAMVRSDLCDADSGFSHSSFICFQLQCFISLQFLFYFLAPSHCPFHSIVSTVAKANLSKRHREWGVMNSQCICPHGALGLHPPSAGFPAWRERFSTPALPEVPI